MPSPQSDPEKTAAAALSATLDGSKADFTAGKREIELMRANRALRTITAASRVRIRAETEMELMNAVCRAIVVDGGYRLAWVGLAENDAGKTIRPVAFFGFDEGYLGKMNLSWADEPRGRGPAGLAIRNGLPAVCRDIMTDPNFLLWRADAIERGYSSVVSLPVRAKGATLGVLSISSIEPDAFDMEEVDLLQELALDLGIGMAALRGHDHDMRALDSLRTKEALFNKLISSIPDRIYFKDRQSRFVQINDSMARRAGLKDASEAVGKTDFDIFTDQHAHQAFEDEQRIMSTGESLIGLDEKETWPDGRVTWASTTKIPLRDAEGRINGLVGISRDVTERKSLEARFLQSQKMDAFGQLAGGVAHDFNNILAAMLLQVSFMKLTSNLPSKVATQMNDLEELTVRAGSLTRQLLTFSRRQDVEMAPLDLNSLLEGTCNMLRRLIGEHVSLELKTSADPLWIEADAGMMEQVVMNLCINARDAMPSGGRLLIETRVEKPDPSATRPGNFACLMVTDTGSGMDQATQARIFEPFFTTKALGKGTGLGLATVYGILQQHHGSVEVDSELGRGSTFRVYLPIKENVAPTVATKDCADVNGGNESILLVEDDEMVRMALAICLKRAGYRVAEASEVMAAVRVWNANNRDFDLLLTDFLMPGGLNGVQLAEQLLREKSSLKVIVVSGYAALPNGAAIPWPKDTVRLSKPFAMRTLLEAVRRCLDSRQVAAAGTTA
jgi:PAS domain S-box-containing protein